MPPTMQTDGVERGAARVLCVFVDAPLDGSTVAVRWRRLGRFVCGMGQARVVVSLALTDEDEAALGAELGAPVSSLGTDVQSRWSGVWKAVSSPWRSWPPARTDVGAARRRTR
jgi:hypothetical protein